MKRRLPWLTLVTFLVSWTAHATYPQPQGFVNDLAGIMEPATKIRLEGMLTAFERESSIEVAVVTVPSLNGTSVEDYTQGLFQTWGIGKKGKENGLLFLIAPNDRRMRVEVGYGLEEILNDARVGRILDESTIPAFKTGDLDGGIVAGTLALVGTIASAKQIPFDVNGALMNFGIERHSPDQKPITIPWYFKLLLLLLMGYLVIRHPWLLFLFLNMGGGGRIGGGFSGGFGGFGGGSSGGGGASRSW